MLKRLNSQKSGPETVMKLHQRVQDKHVSQ